MPKRTFEITAGGRTFEITTGDDSPQETEQQMFERQKAEHSNIGPRKDENILGIDQHWIADQASKLPEPLRRAGGFVGSLLGSAAEGASAPENVAAMGAKPAMAAMEAAPGMLRAGANKVGGMLRTSGEVVSRNPHMTSWPAKITGNLMQRGGGAMEATGPYGGSPMARGGTTPALPMPQGPPPGPQGPPPTMGTPQPTPGMPQTGNPAADFATHFKLPTDDQVASKFQSLYNGGQKSAPHAPDLNDIVAMRSLARSMGVSDDALAQIIKSGGFR